MTQEVAFTFAPENQLEIAEMERTERFSGPYAALLRRIRQSATAGVANVTMRNPDTAEEMEVCITGLTPKFPVL